jgi:hypothetical protein
VCLEVLHVERGEFAPPEPTTTAIVRTPQGTCRRQALSPRQLAPDRPPSDWGLAQDQALVAGRRRDYSKISDNALAFGAQVAGYAGPVANPLARTCCLAAPMRPRFARAHSRPGPIY